MLDEPTVEKWTRQALSNIDREFPNFTGHLVQTINDRHRPSDLHPAFFGSYDWHSAVHMHWFLLRMLRLELSNELKEEVVEALNTHLTTARLTIEAEYLQANPSFEQPYGRAWLLLLQAECRVLREQEGQPELAVAAAHWDDALSVVTDVLTSSIRHWLESTPSPIRHGVHGNSAFALILFRAGAMVLDERLRERVDATARKWFEEDHDAPLHWEPSGHDFLSPALTEAYLMSFVFNKVDFRRWFMGFIPPSSLDVAKKENVRWLAPLEVTDSSDGQQGHLYGLALTRAWQLPRIVEALDLVDDYATAAYRNAFDKGWEGNLEFGLAALNRGENFTHDHWLATFGYLALFGIAQALAA